VLAPFKTNGAVDVFRWEVSAAEQPATRDGFCFFMLSGDNDLLITVSSVRGQLAGGSWRCSMLPCGHYCFHLVVGGLVKIQRLTVHIARTVGLLVRSCASLLWYKQGTK
jgi:hypothetical protein